MNLADIFNTTFNIDEDVKLNNEEMLYEGFTFSPLIAFLAFKDDVVKKATKVVDTVDPKIKLDKAKEKIKAKLEINGNNPNDTVYKLTKEQKTFLTYIYKKYGYEIVKEIKDFRENIMAPYQAIKKSVAKQKSLNDTEVLGMTREEYDRYRESGANKIRKMATKDEDWNTKFSSNNKMSIELKELEKSYEEAKDGKGTINYTHVEQILDKIGLGTDSLKHWAPEELRNTASKINELSNDLKKDTINGKIKLTTRKKSGELYVAPESLKKDIEYLKEFGYSSYMGKRISSDTKKGEFRSAFNNYILRGEKRKELETSIGTSSYKSMYIKTLKDEIEELKTKYKSGLKEHANFSKNYELNNYEKKIWGLKATGIKRSGDLKDWYLKIKPEDFKGTRNYEKSESVKEAEKKIDKELKEFERKLKKTISEEDWKLLLKHRLINNFLTIKDLRKGNGIFKDAKNIDFSSDKKYNINDIKDEIDSLSNKDFSNFKELDSKKKEIEAKINTFEGKEKRELKEYAANFLNRVDNSNSNIKVGSPTEVTALIDKINSTEYTNVKVAESDLRALANSIDDYINNASDKENAKTKISYIFRDIEQARAKLRAAIDGENNDRD